MRQEAAVLQQCSCYKPLQQLVLAVSFIDGQLAASPVSIVALTLESAHVLKVEQPVPMAQVFLHEHVVFPMYWQDDMSTWRGSCCNLVLRRPLVDSLIWPNQVSQEQLSVLRLSTNNLPSSLRCQLISESRIPSTAFKPQ